MALLARILRYLATLQVLVGLLWYIIVHYKKRLAFQQTYYLRYFPTELLTNPKRLRTYLVLFLVFEYLFETLLGKSLPKAAKERSTLLATLTPYFDDWTDDTSLDFENLPDFLAQTPSLIQTPADACAYLFSTSSCTWDTHWKAVADAQLLSRAQKSGTLEEFELWDIMEKKGSSSVLLGWTVVTEQEGGAAMKRCSHSLGMFAQLLNDLFDVWKDREDGIATVVTNLIEIDQLGPVYDRVFEVLIDQIADVKTRGWAKQKTIGFLVIGYALGRVALRQLVQLQQRNKGRFEVYRFDRSELVCDMALWRNRLAFAWEVLRY